VGPGRFPLPGFESRLAFGGCGTYRPSFSFSNDLGVGGGGVLKRRSFRSFSRSALVYLDGL